MLIKVDLVLLNLSLNAIEAMPYGGTLFFCRQNKLMILQGVLQVTFTDSGKRVPEDVQS